MKTEIKLANPVEVAGITYTALFPRLPTIEDYAAVRRLNVSRQLRTMKLIALLTGVNTRDLELIFSANEAAVSQCGALRKNWFGY